MIWAYSFRGVNPSLQGAHGRAEPFTTWWPGRRRGRREGGQNKWATGKRRREEEGGYEKGGTSSLLLLCLGKLITAFG